MPVTTAVRDVYIVITEGLQFGSFVRTGQTGSSHRSTCEALVSKEHAKQASGHELATKPRVPARKP